MGSSCATGTVVDSWFGGRGEEAIVLKVVHAPMPTDESIGTRCLKYKQGDVISISTMHTPAGLEPLNDRARSSARLWPQQYRFKAHRRFWSATATSSSGVREIVVLQMASSPEDRSLDNAKLDVEDALLAGNYAHRFNVSPAVTGGNMSPDEVRNIKVAIPVVCQVTSSQFPAMVPTGTLITMTPYRWDEVQKYVFEGNEEFSELPQAYFHHAAFSSGSKHFVCDIQGTEDDAGDFIIMDPCILRSEKPTLTGMAGSVVPPVMAAANQGSAPTYQRFDAMHPRCSQLCQVFDGERKVAKRNVGFCSSACGIGV